LPISVRFFSLKILLSFQTSSCSSYCLSHHSFPPSKYGLSSYVSYPSFQLCGKAVKLIDSRTPTCTAPGTAYPVVSFCRSCCTRGVSALCLRHVASSLMQVCLRSSIRSCTLRAYAISFSLPCLRQGGSFLTICTVMVVETTRRGLIGHHHD
jgi:hypothetical protein